jgi:hypothetical protein
MHWIVYLILVIFCYLIFQHNPEIILFVIGGVICYKLFFNHKVVDRTPELWEKEIKELDKISILMEQMNKILGRLARSTKESETESDLLPQIPEIPIEEQLEHLPIN